jgi:hypothetical protein
MIIIYILTKSNVPRYSISRLITIKPKTKEIIRMAAMLIL